jgi:hypothetical protein
MSANKLKGQTPTFALVKNISFLQIGDDDLVFEGEVLGTSKEIIPLLDKMPRPKVDLENPETKAKLMVVFEEEDITADDLFFEDHPAQFIQEFEVTDNDLFGESYSIILATDGDIDTTADFIINVFKQEVLGEPTEEIQDYHLVELWEEFIDRIALIQTPEKISEDYSFFSEVIKRVEEKLDELPNAPTEEVWESFEAAFEQIYDSEE